jgi:hypothetical protein
MAFIIVKGQVFRPVVVTAVSRRNELWAETASLCQQIQKIAEEEKKSDINKVEATKDIYLELRQKLRELGCW